MSKFVLSNNLEWYNNIRACYEKVGFPISKANEESRYNIAVFKKLNINNDNYYSDGSDFAACSGTLFYNGRWGSDSLKLLLEDLHSSSIIDVRKKAVGTYAIVAKIGERIISFIDEVGAYGLYYYQGESGYVVTNTYYHIGKCVGTKMNQLACMEELCEYSIYDNQTPFDGIFRLMGDEILEINIDADTFNIKNVELNHYILKDKDFKSIVQTIAEKICNYAELQELCKKRKIVFLTGGVDSRLAVAADLAAGIKPALGNWQGSPIYMNTKIEDREIMNLLADKTDLEMVNLDVSEGEEGLIDESAFDKYGEAAMIYGNNKKWFGFFEKSKYGLYDFGYFGEIIRDLDILNAVYKRPMSVNIFSKMYMSRTTYNYVGLSKEDEEKYHDYVSHKIKSTCIKCNLNQNDLSLEDCMQLYLLYRIHADEKACNFANNFGYCFNLLGQKELVDLINQVPYEYRKESKFNLALTKALYPDLLEIRYYSHSVFKVFDRKKMVLKDDISTSIRIKKKVKSMIGLSLCKKYDNMKFKLKRDFKMDKSDTEEAITRCLNMCNKVNKEFFLKVDEKSFTYLPLYIAYMSMLSMFSYVIKQGENSD